VLEPGKVMQANRGVLLVDELGKLPRGTQNVLLQAFQESTVSPSKSRETFPASFLAVTTSNLEDMDNINDPLTGRLTSIYVGFNEDHDKNRGIVDLNFRPRVFAPELLREAAVRTTERWRRTAGDAPDLAEVGSNRTMIDVLRRAESHALLRGARAVTLDDFRAGAREAMTGRVRGRSGEGWLANRDAVDGFLDKHAKALVAEAATWYWCLFFTGTLADDKSEADRVVRETRDVVKDPRRLAEALASGSYPKFAKWLAFVEGREGKAPEDERAARVALVWNVLEESGAFA
jgi:Mg-chelatase subunit ChlI